ncbi:hypothetical protein KI387_032537, partial [Taxus chinensis]
MEDTAGIVRRKNASKPIGKYSESTRLRPDTRDARRSAKSLDNICLEKQRFNPMERNPYDPVEYNDVFGGPPNCISARKRVEKPPIQRRPYDEVFRAFEQELNLNTGSSSLPVFELPVYENSSLPVFELPVFGGSDFPVFELPSSRDDLGNRGTTPKSSSDEFYADIFRGGSGLSNSVYEELTTKSLFSRPSWSRSKSSPSHPSTEERSPHDHALSGMAGDLSLSALASKLRPIALSKQDRPFIFGPYGTRHTGYQSQGSDNASVGSSSCSSPSQFFSDSTSVPSFRSNKPRAFCNRTGRLNADDVFGGFSQQRPFPHKQPCRKTEGSISEFKTGKAQGTLHRTNIFEKYPVLIDDPRKNSVKYVYEVGDMSDVSLAKKPTKETSLPIDTMHLMTHNTLGSSPLEHLAAAQKVKSWRDWVPESKYAQFSFKRDPSSCLSACNSYVSPITEASCWAQEEPVETRLEALGRKSLDDGEISDVPGCYGIKSVSDRKKNFIFHNKVDYHVDDSSDIAIKEAIAWAKEKFQGSMKEGKVDAAMFVQGPNDKDVQAQAGDANTKGLRQGGHGTSMNGEGRKQKASNEILPQGTLERSQNHGEGLMNQSEHTSEPDDQLFIYQKERDQHPQETESCPLTELEERLIKEVSEDVTVDHNQQMANQDIADTFFSTPELQDTYALGTASAGGANQKKFSRLLDEWAYYELERLNIHSQADDCKTSKYERNCTLAASL